MAATIPINDTDRRLAEDIQSGSKVAFNKLYTLYAPALLGFVMKIVPDQKAAEGIMQQSFLVMWNHKGSIGLTPLFAWALGITRKTALSALNNIENGEIQNAPAIVYIRDMVENGTTPEEKKLESALFELVYFYGYSIADASGLLNMKSDNLKLMLRKAVKNINAPL